MPGHFQHLIEGETVRDNHLLILGNGLSMDRYDYRRLKNKLSLSVEIDVKSWDLADWRPTYIACLDDCLIKTHLDEILLLLNEKRIQRFFLSGRALELIPELTERSDVHYLDEFVPHWFEIRGKAHGLKFRESTYFWSSFDDCVTSESYSVRYGAFLGHQAIVLLGNVIKHAQSAEALDLQEPPKAMSDASTTNPHYVAAIRAVRDDFHRGQLPVRITAADPNSRLVREAIVPHEPLENLLGEASVGVVIVPLTASEHKQLLDNLWLWSQPAFAPFLGPTPARLPDLVFVCNNAAAALCEPEIQKALAHYPALRNCFDQVRFVVLDLAGDADLYRRENHGPKASQGFRAGPNNVFFAALDAVRGHWGHSLYIETDCIPIRPDWLGQINRHLDGAEPAWVTGSIYRGADALGPQEKRHINGNALYATSDTAFQNFVDTVWRPKLAEIVAERPELPFDCVIEALYERADARLGDADAGWKTLRNVSHKFRYSALIPNLTSESGTLHALADQIEDLLRTSPESCIVHTRTLANYIGLLRRSGSIPSMPELLAIVREAADGLPPRPPVSRHARRKAAGWSVGRIRQGLARRIPTNIKRLID